MHALSSHRYQTHSDAFDACAYLVERDVDQVGRSEVCRSLARSLALTRAFSKSERPASGLGLAVERGSFEIIIAHDWSLFCARLSYSAAAAAADASGCCFGRGRCHCNARDRVLAATANRTEPMASSSLADAVSRLWERSRPTTTRRL